MHDPRNDPPARSPSQERPGSTVRHPGVADRAEIRRLPREVVAGFVDHAEEFLEASPVKQLLLAFAAGSFIAIGSMVSVVVTVGVEPEGLSRLMLGLGFSIGFVLVVLSGAALVTEVNVLLPELILSGRRRFGRRYWRFWIIVLFGNAVGAMFVGGLVNAADVIGGANADRLEALIEEKLRFEDMGAEGWFRAVASGVLGNWLVGMAAFLAMAARTLTGKILGIVFPVVAFVALGVQHAPANMGYFAAAVFNDAVEIDVADAILWNLAPAMLGNIIGAAVLVSVLFWYSYGAGPGGAGVPGGFRAGQRGRRAAH